MEKEHYIINIEKYSSDIETIKKLESYLDDIESVFLTIEEVFGQNWNDDKINIKLNDSKPGPLYKCPLYRYSKDSHFVEMSIYNENIQEKYPDNLWGCLFHETHHAFLNQITHNKRDGEILNGNNEEEVFNSAFMAATYWKLKEKDMIEERLYNDFLRKLKNGLKDNSARDFFCEYVDIFSRNTKNFAKFICYVKSSDSVFTNPDRFQQDFDEVKKIW